MNWQEYFDLHGRTLLCRETDRQRHSVVALVYAHRACLPTLRIARYPRLEGHIAGIRAARWITGNVL